MRDDNRTRPDRPLDRIGRTAAAVILAAALAGCVGAKVANVSAINAGGPTPVEILVAMDAPARIDNAQAHLVAQVGTKLQADLVQSLTEAHVTAEPFVPGTSHPGAAVLHVSVTKADPGSAIERFIIGFGAGRAELQVTADLASTDDAQAQSITRFDTSGDTGRKPGLILPGGVALATHDLVHLAIGGAVQVATSTGDDIDRPTQKTAAAITGQLQKYYQSVGWTWPARA